MAPKNQTEISILEITQSQVRFAVLGRTPIILYRMSEKAKGELLMPKGRKTAAEKASSLKHNPFEEFKMSPYRLVEDDAPTLLAHLATAFKKAIAGAAIDIPGAAKAQIGRLLWVEGERVPIYGIPKLHMAITRSADMGHTPDVRTRCIVPEWAAFVDISYTTPILKEPVIANLFAAAGLIQGVGDWRPQKGSGTFGQFKLVDGTDEKFLEIVETGGREAQIEAMEAYEPYDAETEEMLSWFVSEAEKRGHKEILREKRA
jgi:hypothetical protein